jgi:CubicO group peptidase (beta-lactamase class C family)
MACSDGGGHPPDAGPDGVRSALETAFEVAQQEGYSGVALVRYQGQTLLREAAGEASRADESSNRMDTPFDVGSLTKQFTAAAILALVEENELSLDDTLERFFESVPEDKADITVHQLLTHTAGLPDAVGDDDEAVARDEYLERVFARELYYSPGEVHYYSNVGYSLLAAIIETVSGQSYEGFLKSTLFEPAGMQQTGYLLPEWPIAPALGYFEERVDDPFERPHDETGYTWNLRGNGGMLSTAEDLLLWHQALSQGKVLNEELVSLLQTPHVDEGIGHTFYGYGWVVEPTSAGTLLWHDGGNGFFFAQVLRYEDADLQVITLANEATLAAEDLARTLASTVLPELGQDEIEWDLLFEDGFDFEELTETRSEAIGVSRDEEHIAGFGGYVESGHLDFRVLDPAGEVFFEDHVQSGEYRERIFAIDERDGTWSLELELTDATGDAFMGWGRRVE